MRSVVVVGGSIAGVQAALDLAEAGIKTYLVEGLPFLGFVPRTSPSPRPEARTEGSVEALSPRGADATGADETTLCRLRPRLLRAAGHPNIEVLYKATVTQIDDQGGDGSGRGPFRVAVSRQPRYVDPARCTACGDCERVCPVTTSQVESARGGFECISGSINWAASTFEGDGFTRKAISGGGYAAVPNLFSIERRGTAPCRHACPAHQRAQGYIALIREGRYEDALRVIKEDNPFPAICGRICNHRCEEECNRNKVDEPVSIMALKRFVADWVYANCELRIAKDEQSKAQSAIVRLSAHDEVRNPQSSRVAIVGSGPAGLTAAQDLVKLGYGVTVFEALPVAGGMMRVGVPEYRLPREMLQQEIEDILAQGVELRLNTRIDDVEALLNDGYQAVFLAVGAHRGKKLPIPGADLPDVLLNTDFLRRVNLGEEVALGKRVLVLGGGNVAIDVARTALRLPHPREVHMACLESRETMPAHPWEIEEAEAEGIVIHPSRAFKRILCQDGRVTGVECLDVTFMEFDEEGRLTLETKEGSEHVLAADTVIFSIGQAPDLSLLSGDGGVEVTRRGTIAVAPDTLATGRPGVFAGGDAVTGTTFVVDAIAAGHKAARSIDRYLRGEALVEAGVHLLPKVELTAEEITEKLERGEIVKQARAQMPQLSPAERNNNFKEVNLGFSEEMALAEAERCLQCGICSECLECVEACQPGAINHQAQEQSMNLDVGAIILADGRQGVELLGMELPEGGGWPLESEREGIYLVGPDDTIQASAAAAKAMIRVMGHGLGIRGYGLGVRDSSSQAPLSPNPYSLTPRIGVFLCRCGDQIGGVVDLTVVGDHLRDFPGVTHVQELSFACQPEGALAIEEAVVAQGLNRVVLAACSCCALDQICYSCSTQRLRCKGNLLDNPLYSSNSLHFSNPLFPSFEFVNIRQHCASVHGGEPVQATAKAVDLVAAAVAKAQLSASRPPKRMAIERSRKPEGRIASAKRQIRGLRERVEIERAALIVGGGRAAQASAAALAALGFGVVQADEAEVAAVKGRVGDFVVALESKAGQRNVPVGAIILAADAEEERARLAAAFGSDRLFRAEDPLWEPVVSKMRGVFLAGPDQPSLEAHEARVWGLAAAAKAAILLHKGWIEAELIRAQVDEPRCRGCGDCQKVCEFGAIRMVEDGPGLFVAQVDEALCRGCGTCVAHCPSGAITAGYSSDRQIEAMLEAMLA